MVEKHKTRKNQQTFYKCNISNNTVKTTLYCITTIKAKKGIKNINNANDGQGLANNYDRQIQGQTNVRSTFVMGVLGVLGLYWDFFFKFSKMDHIKKCLLKN